MGVARTTLLYTGVAYGNREIDWGHGEGGVTGIEVPLGHSDTTLGGSGIA